MDQNALRVIAHLLKQNDKEFIFNVNILYLQYNENKLNFICSDNICLKKQTYYLYKTNTIILINTYTKINIC